MTVRYGPITAVRDVTLAAEPGQSIAIVGPNGAGKSTLLLTVAGLLKPSSGSIRVDNDDTSALEPEALVRRGVALVPERRRIFRNLSVVENLLIGGVTAGSRVRRDRLDEVVETFPVLRPKWDLAAGFLSGGEAQQLAFARALMSAPRLLLLDEPTLGLSPALVDVVFDLMAIMRNQGITLMIVEQHTMRALEFADRGYVLRTGRVELEGSGSQLAARSDLFDAFVGRATRRASWNA